jgi:isopenicillin-N N-acyltransferase like protein
VGDGRLGEFRGFQHSYSVLNVFDDRNMRPYNQSWHPRLPSMVYYGMDWLCPSYNLVLSQQLRKLHGQLTPELAIQLVPSVEMSGSNHVAFYDLVGMNLWFSFAAPHNVGGPVNAYDRQFTHVNVWRLFNESQPAF